MMKGDMHCGYRTAEIVASLLFIVLTLFLLRETLGMSMGTWGSPGPGVFPLGVLAMLLAGSVILLLRAVLERRRSGSGEPIQLGNGRIWITLLVLAAVSYMLEPLGYAISIFVLMAALLRAYSSLSLVRIVLASLLASAVAWGFFVRLLGVQLPAGIL